MGPLILFKDIAYTNTAASAFVDSVMSGQYEAQYSSHHLQNALQITINVIDYYKCHRSIVINIKLIDNYFTQSRLHCFIKYGF